MIRKFLNLFRKPIIIPLTTNGVENGTWIEIYKNDKYYKMLVQRYGLPLPQQIEVEPVEEN
jgi:hypothetical protein